MVRQKIRRGIILVSLLLFPVTMFYFSPAIIIAGAFAGVITGSFICFGLMFLGSLFLGRVFCGWLCPAAGLGEACFCVCDKPARGGRLDWIKYFIWVPWLVTIIFGAIKAGGFGSVAPFFHIDKIISISQPWCYIIYYFFIVLIVVLSLTAGKRAFCHYVCWMAPFMILGRKLAGVVNLPALRLKADSDKCIDCKKCTKSCPMSLDVNAMVKKTGMERAECILCASCADSCCKGAITYSFGKCR